MNDYLTQIMTVFNKRSERERMIITVLMVAFIFLIWLPCFFLPLTHKANSLHGKLMQVERHVDAISIIYKDYRDIIQSSPAEAGKKIKVLEDKLVALQHHPLLVKQMIHTPEDMKNLLQSISKTGAMLSLDQEQGMTATPIPNQTADLANQKIVVEFDGGYFETIRYLQYLEALPWYLSFDSLDYQVEQYPNAKIKIVINVLKEGSVVDHHA